MNDYDISKEGNLLDLPKGKLVDIIENHFKIEIITDKKKKLFSFGPNPKIEKVDYLLKKLYSYPKEQIGDLIDMQFIGVKNGLVKNYSRFVPEFCFMVKVAKDRNINRGYSKKEGETEEQALKRWLVEIDKPIEKFYLDDDFKKLIIDDYRYLFSGTFNIIAYFFYKDDLNEKMDFKKKEEGIKSQ